MTHWLVWPAQIGAEADLVRLEQLSFGARSWGGPSVETSLRASGVSVLLGGEKKDAPSGFAIWRDLAGEAELLSIGVSPHVCNQALGRRLLAAVMDAARQAGALKLFLEVDAGNAAALALYRKAGFSDIGRRSAYYKDGADALAMQLQL